MRVWKGNFGPYHVSCSIDDPVTIPRAQYEALMALHKAAETYYYGYVQDEADEEGICGRAQQLAAMELRDSLAALRSAGI